MAEPVLRDLVADLLDSNREGHKYVKGLLREMLHRHEAEVTPIAKDKK